MSFTSPIATAAELYHMLSFNQLAFASGQFLLMVVIQMVLSHFAKGWKEAEKIQRTEAKKRSFTILMTLYPRLCSWMWICGIYTIAAWYLHSVFNQFWPGWATEDRQEKFLLAVTLLCGVSFFGQILYLTNRRLIKYVTTDSGHWENVLVVIIGELIQIGLPLVIVHFIIPLFGLSDAFENNFRKLVSFFMVASVGYLIARLVNLAADKVVAPAAKKEAQKLSPQVHMRNRSLQTQVAVLRRVAVAIVTFFTMACLLMFFAPMRQIGTSLIASAGVIGVVAGLAAQRSLGNLLAGFQIALTQPILLDDAVKVEGEYGFVEEISLYYVVVRLWDQRRMVVPISYFLEKPFENWTRRSSEMLGTVFLYLDYRVPIEEVRAEFNRILDEEPLWDKRVRKLQITNTLRKSVELRALVSAENPSVLFDLRCIVREKLVTYLREQYAHHLHQVNKGGTVVEAKQAFIKNMNEKDLTNNPYLKVVGTKENVS